MTRNSPRRIILSALALPLAIALAACGGNEEAAAPPSGEPIAAVPAPDGASWVETASVTPEDGYVMGNPDAPLKLIEFVSHTCPACSHFSQESSAGLDELVASGRVSVEIRNQVHDPLDLTIAMLVRCGSPESFHPLAKQAWAGLNDIVGSAQANGAAMNAAMQAPPEQRYQAIAEAAGLIDFFAARGISRDQSTQCLADSARAEQIAENSQTQSAAMNVTGTPTFFLNGAPLDGSNWASVEAALQQAGAR